MWIEIWKYAEMTLKRETKSKAKQIWDNGVFFQQYAVKLKHTDEGVMHTKQLLS